MEGVAQAGKRRRRGNRSGTYFVVGRWEKNKCEWGDRRSGELHEHMIRQERERGSRRHQRAEEGGICACDLDTGTR